MIFKRPDIIRPPSEARSYFLPITSGCSNNSCGFCNFYSCHLALRELQDIKNEIDALALFVNNGIQIPDMPYIMYLIADEWDGRRIFLQDGDALVYPYLQLKECLLYLNKKFPNLERVGCYATTQDILRYSVDDLKSLRELKLNILYLGVETGDDDILRYIGKGVTSKQIIEASKKIKDANIVNSSSVILGLGGPSRSLEHALSIAKILSETDPEYVGALTLTLIPNTPMFEDNRKGRFTLVTPMQSLQELKIIIEKATFTNCFFSSMHASNYFSIRGKLPFDKTEMLSQLDYILASHNPSLLKPEFMRGL